MYIIVIGDLLKYNLVFVFVVDELECLDIVLVVDQIFNDMLVMYGNVGLYEFVVMLEVVMVENF